jgi:hypothetical protein
VEHLEGFMSVFPAEVLTNPVFKLHVAMTEGFLEGFSEHTQAIIAGYPVTEPEVIRFLAESRSRPGRVRAAAARNPVCPEDMLFSFMRHNRDVRSSLAMNRMLPSVLCAELSRQHSSIAYEIARREDVEPEILAAMATPEQDERIIAALVDNASTPASLVKKLRKRLKKAEKRRREAAMRSGIAWFSCDRIDPIGQ